MTDRTIVIELQTVGVHLTCRTPIAILQIEHDILIGSLIIEHITMSWAPDIVPWGRHQKDIMSRRSLITRQWAFLTHHIGIMVSLMSTQGVAIVIDTIAFESHRTLTIALTTGGDTHGLPLEMTPVI